MTTPKIVTNSNSKSGSKPEFMAVDFQLTTMIKFPSTAKKAGEVWTNYLNEMASDGWVLVSVFQYPLGVELNRKMLIFRKEV